MDSAEEKTRAQQGPDAKTAAKIVRTIDAVEQAYINANGPISNQFMEMVGDIVTVAINEDWQVMASEWELYITCPEWRCTRGRGRGDAWLELGDIIEDENEHTWLAVAVAAGPTHMCLELKFRNGIAPIETCLKASPQLAAKLTDEGFEQRDDGTRLVFPIKIDREALAKAFERGNFDDALAPLQKAISAIVGMQQDLDDLVGLARTKAKGK